VRGSLTRVSDADGAFLESLLRSQAAEDSQIYPVDADEYRKLVAHRVRRADKDVTVTVPDDTERETTSEIGSRMGMQIWIPRGDRAAVLAEWRSNHSPVLERLPLNYDDTTLRTIERIDILWLRGRSIKRAFEVEHTTSIYSSILRMADLLALQPPIWTSGCTLLRRHTDVRRSKKKFYALCSLSLSAAPFRKAAPLFRMTASGQLATLPHLSYLSDTVLDEYDEEA